MWWGKAWCFGRIQLESDWDGGKDGKGISMCIYIYIYITYRLSKSIQSTFFSLWHFWKSVFSSMKWAAASIWATSDSSPLHLFILRPQLSNTSFSCTKEPHDSSHGPRQDFKCRRRQTNNNSHSRFACFYLCVFWGLAFLILKKGITELSEVDPMFGTESSVTRLRKFPFSRPRILGS